MLYIEQRYNGNAQSRCLRRGEEWDRDLSEVVLGVYTTEAAYIEKVCGRERDRPFSGIVETDTRQKAACPRLAQ